MTQPAWGDKFAKAADSNERAGFDEAVRLTLEVAAEEAGDLEFGAEMVLQHYRHPAEVTTPALMAAAAVGEAPNGD